MNTRIAVLTLVLAVASSAAAAVNSPEPIQELKAGEITISYPVGLEKQAKELAVAAGKVVAPRRDRFLRNKQALSDNEKIAKRMCDLMGCPERLDTVRSRLAEYNMADVVSAMLGHIKVYRESDIREHGSVKEGPWTIVYNPQTNGFRSNLGMTNSDETRAAVMPLVVRTNGKFETDGKPLTEFLQAQCELYEHILEMPIHEIAESVVAEDMKLYHPYARWFNEGVATWVMLTVVSEMAPDWANECRKSQLPARNEPLRAQVNLRAWLQDAYQKKDQSEQEADLSRECYRFATEAIERMLSGQPKDALARVLQKLKDKPFADTGTICAAISDVTGKDPSRILLDYAPNRARAISRKEDIGKLIGQAAQKAKEGSYSEAVELLSRLMEIAPQRNLELNLAWAMRKAGLPKSESEWHIRVAAAPQGSGDFQLMLMVHDAESQYVAGRFAQFCSTAEQAKDLFESALKLDPRHADAKAALKELGSIK